MLDTMGSDRGSVVRSPRHRQLCEARGNPSKQRIITHCFRGKSCIHAHTLALKHLLPHMATVQPRIDRGNGGVSATLQCAFFVAAQQLRGHNGESFIHAHTLAGTHLFSHMATVQSRHVRGNWEVSETLLCAFFIAGASAQRSQRRIFLHAHT